MRRDGKNKKLTFEKNGRTMEKQKMTLSPAQRMWVALGIIALVVVVVAPLAGATTKKTETTQNGFPVIEQSETESWNVGGRTFYTAPGAPTVVLKDLTRWFHTNVESLAYGGEDEWSWSPPRKAKLGTSISNHASGTAVDLNATLHPLGKKGTFSERQTAMIREKLKEYGGAVRWGGDYKTGDEMHFEIQVNK